MTTRIHATDRRIGFWTYVNWTVLGAIAGFIGGAAVYMIISDRLVDATITGGGLLTSGIAGTIVVVPLTLLALRLQSVGGTNNPGV